jgi:uncharacterized protein (UPF0305 family)
MDKKEYLIVLSQILESLKKIKTYFLLEDHSFCKDRHASYELGVVSEYVAEMIFDIRSNQQCEEEKEEECLESYLDKIDSILKKMTKEDD